jgi:DNA-binding HxlR family transcriptional regulator
MARDARQIEAFQQGAEACPLFAATELIGERWSFLILRGALLGLCHFEEYQSCLGIARNILSDRLAKLVNAGILTRTPDPKDRRKLIYSFTERGEALLPVLIAIRQWGIDSGLAKPSHPTLSDRRDRRPVRRLSVQAHDGRDLTLDDLVWIDADGTELPVPLPAKASRRAA